MKVKFPLVLLSLLLVGALAAAQHIPENPLPRNENQIVRDVRDQLLTLPNAGVFDNITYEVHNGRVILNGQVVQPSLRSEAKNAVQNVEGVRDVVDHIEVLAPSPGDENLRMAEFRSIYQYPGLQKYEIGMWKPIRIIVEHGHVMLYGEVDSEPDRELAGNRALQVQGVRNVTNNLQVVQP